MKPVFKFRRLYPEATIPVRATSQAACYDVHAFLSLQERPGENNGRTHHVGHSYDEELRLQVVTPHAVYHLHKYGFQHEDFPPCSGVNLPHAVLPPGSIVVIGTGLNLRIPDGWEIEVRPRSGLAAKHGITVLNTPGTIDSDFSGDGPEKELKIILYNAGRFPFVVCHGDRIAQLAFRQAPEVEVIEDFNDYNGKAFIRMGGLGSTGIS